MREFKLLNGVNNGDAGEKETIIVLESENHGAIIPSHFVFFFEARDKKVYVRTEFMEYPSDMTLKELEETKMKGFIRCHRSYLVNTEYVTLYDKNNNELIMKDGLRVPVSRACKERVVDFLGEKGKGTI